MTRRRDLVTTWRYARTLLGAFRRTFAALAALVLLGALAYSLTPHAALGGQSPRLHTALYGAWMALFAQPILSPPETWYLDLLCAIYPLFGFVLIGEGVVRLGLLLLSRERGERDWMKVTASTYRDHVVLCGLGHLGARILEQLAGEGVPVVVIERNPTCAFLPAAKATGAPILAADMRDDATLRDAGIARARSVILATSDDVANLEVALDARRLNPSIRVLLRMFDQRIASKIREAFAIDHAFSSTALAAPIVAAMARRDGVLASFAIGGVAHLAAELAVAARSALAGAAVADVEARFGARLLSLSREGGPPAPPAPTAVLAAGDRLVVHVAADRVSAIAEAAQARAAAG